MANSFSGKHVFTEKPIAISIDDCCKLEEAHEQAKHLKFATGFVLRHAPLYIEIQRLLLSGELGKVVSVEANEMLRPYHGGYIMRNWRRKAALAGPHILEKVGDTGQRAATPFLSSDICKVMTFAVDVYSCLMCVSLQLVVLPRSGRS